MTFFKRLLMTGVFLFASNVCLWAALLDWAVWVEVLLGVLGFVGFVLLNVFVPRPKQPSKRLRFLSGWDSPDMVSSRFKHQYPYTVPLQDNRR